MSYMVSAGNLAGPVRIEVDKDGHVKGKATVIVNDKSRDEQGEWSDVGSTGYSLYVRGGTAKNLAHFQEVNGNGRVVFSGRLQVRKYRDLEGNERIARNVFVDHVGADFLFTSYLNEFVRAQNQSLPSAPQPGDIVDEQVDDHSPWEGQEAVF